MPLANVTQRYILKAGLRYTTRVMKKRPLTRNIDARAYLDAFLVSAAASIMLLRLGLHLTNYPQIGGAKYHIAHVLWGGMLMLAAFILNFAFLGRHLQKMVAVLGGVGFGIFIDEIGKFITRDVNYFFQPAVGIIYAVFVALYILVGYLTRSQKYTSDEYQLNALRRLEEAVHKDMDVHERAATRKLLSRARQSDVLTQKLHDLLYEVPLSASADPGPIMRIRTSLARWYERMWSARSSRTVVRLFFAVQMLVFLVAVVSAAYSNLDDVRDFFVGRADYGHSLVLGQLTSTIAAVICTVVGLVWIKQSRYHALQWFRRATLINLLLTEFFLFSRIQLGAIPSFIFNLILYILLDLVVSYERIAHSKEV